MLHGGGFMTSVSFTETGVNPGNPLNPAALLEYYIQPGSAPSTSIYVPFRRRVIWNTAQNLSGGGHVVAGLDLLDLSGAGNINLGIGHESKINANVAATYNNIRGYEMNVNILHASAVINTMAGAYPNIVSNLGQVGLFIPHSFNVESNGGQLPLILAYHNPNLAAITGITTKRFLYNQDADAISETASPTLGAQSLELSPAAHPGIATGQYYFCIAHSTPTPVAVSADFMYVSLIMIPHRQTFTKIGVTCTTAQAAKNARLGIYKFAAGIATSKVLDAGEVSLATTGDKEITISQRLEAGVYGLVFHTNATTAAINWSAISIPILSPILGDDASNTADASAKVLLTGSQSYGALPSTFPAMTRTGVPAQPRIWLRA